MTFTLLLIHYSGKDSTATATSTSTPDRSTPVSANNEDTPGGGAPDRKVSSASPSRGGGGGYNDRNATESEDPDKILVNAKLLQPKWEFVRHAETEEKSSTNPYPMAFMGSGSTLSTAVHFGLSNFNANISWYGVSHNTVTVGKAGDLVLCEGVTLLPLGDKWISLALLCIGVQNGIKGAICNTFNPRDVASYITPDELDCSSDICDAFSELKHQPVGVDTNLISLVKRLFRVGGGGGDDGVDDSSSDDYDEDDEGVVGSGSDCGEDVKERIKSARREIRQMNRKSTAKGPGNGGSKGKGKGGKHEGGDRSNGGKKKNGGGGGGGRK